MAEEMPFADLLFTHLLTAIDRLRSHDAHCSFEAAELLGCVLDVLRTPNATRAYNSNGFDGSVTTQLLHEPS